MGQKNLLLPIKHKLQYVYEERFVIVILPVQNCTVTKKTIVTYTFNCIESSQEKLTSIGRVNYELCLLGAKANLIKF